MKRARDNGAVPKAIREFQRGRMVILVDDENRENEGDLCIPAEKVTPKAINFMATHGRGLICLALTERKIRELQLPMMVSENTSPYGTAFTISVEARRGVTTGISAKDRATTVLAVVRKGAKPSDLVSPGHVFPLRARDGGVLVRTGQTEGSVDLARLAGLEPAAVICEIMNPDGTMARRPQLLRFARQHGLSILSIAQLVRYRLEREQHLRAVGETKLPVAELGEFRVLVYQSGHDTRTHLALVRGVITPGMPVLVRMHTACPTGDVFGSGLCNCGRDLRRSLARIAAEGRGLVVYLQKELRTPASVLSCTHRAEPGSREASDDDLREFGIGAQILRDLGASKLRLLTDNPRRIVGLDGFGIEVTETVPLAPARAVPRRAG